MRLGPTLGALAALVGAVSLARADDATNLDSGVNSHDAARWNECVERFNAMLNPNSPTAITDPELKKRARMYDAACLVALGKDAEADKQIETLLLDDPRYFPDKAAFSSKVIDRFTAARGRLKDELDRREAARIAAEEADRKRREEQKAREQARQAAIELLARQEVTVEKNSRFWAAIPFGVGQFQNRQRGLGYAFLGAEAALGAASIVLDLVYGSIVRQGQSGTVDREAAIRQRDRVVLANRITFAGFAAVAVGGIIHAEATFVPQFVDVHERPLPKELLLSPTIGFDAHGMTAGLGGQW